MAPTAGPSPTLHPLRAKHTIRKDLSKPVLRRMIESRGREQEDKSQDTLRQVLLAIQYEKDLDMDGNILYLIESAKELLPRYIKTSKGLILPREIHYTLTNIRGLEKEIGVVKKERSKLKHLLGIEHGKIPNSWIYGETRYYSGERDR
jgi:hypothetical protein